MKFEPPPKLVQSRSVPFVVSCDEGDSRIGWASDLDADRSCWRMTIWKQPRWSSFFVSQATEVPTVYLKEMDDETWRWLWDDMIATIDKIIEKRL